MVALLVLRIWLADLLARCQGFRNVLGSIGELLCMCCRVLAFVLLGEETCLFGELEQHSKSFEIWSAIILDLH